MSWDERWAARRRENAELLPDPWVRERITSNYTHGPCLDLACGSGRHGLLLAKQGVPVHFIDGSPVALEWVEEQLHKNGLSGFTHCFEIHSPFEQLARICPQQGWSLVIVFHFLDRALLRNMHRFLGPGGRLIFCQPTRINLQRNPRPSSRFLLEPGEAPELVPGLDLLEYQEGWFDGQDPVRHEDLEQHPQARHEARIVAAKP